MLKKLSMLQQSQNPTVEEVFEQYIKKCIVRNLSGETVKLYRVHYSEFMRISEGITFISDITMEVLDNFTLSKKGEVTAITVNSYLRSLRAFLYWCMEQGYIKPFSIKLIKAEKKIKVTYTDAELRILLKKPNINKINFNQYKIYVLSNYLLATGNRISSALDLKIKNLDFDSDLIIIEKTKNRKQQIIPMSSTLKEILIEYLTYRKGGLEDYVLCNSYGEKADMRTTQQSLADYNTSKGILKKSCHLYRHTFAKNWIINGGDIFRLQKILGHSDLQVVKEYVNMFSSDLSIDFDKFNPLDNMNLKGYQKTIQMR
jgi:integrase/recombinase XerD